MDIIWFDLTVAFFTGVLGSIHCVGMCGPLILGTCAIAKVKQNILGTTAYLIGKLISYALVGLIVGALGAWLISQAWIKNVAAYFSIALGTAMIAVIIFYWVFPAKSQALFATQVLKKVSKFISPEEKNQKQSYLILGLTGFFTALLPCGLLYAMILRAAAEHSPVLSMFVMISFGLGTSPALLIVGSILSKLPQTFRRHANKVGEIILLITAAIILYRGIMGLISKEGKMDCCDNVRVMVDQSVCEWYEKVP